MRRLRASATRGLRLTASILAVVAVAYAAVTVLAYLGADRLIFQPPPALYRAGDLPFRRVPVDGRDSIALLYIPNAQARYTILFSHGNAEDLGHVYPFLEQLRSFGFGVIGYDYRGYGRSDAGPPSARRATEDAEAAYRYAVDSLGIPPDRLILHGRSLGSGPTLALAARHGAAGVILESAFTSTYRVLTQVRLLPFDRFPNAALIGGLHCPVLVIHGTRDGVVPFSHGRALYAAAPGPKQSLWVEGAGHNDVLEVAGDRYLAALNRFVRLLDEGSAARTED